MDSVCFGVLDQVVCKMISDANEIPSDLLEKLRSLLPPMYRDWKIEKGYYDYKNQKFIMQLSQYHVKTVVIV